MDDQGEGAGNKRPGRKALSRATHDLLGKALRDHYDDLAREPMPPAMRDLLARLEQAETAPDIASGTATDLSSHRPKAVMGKARPR